MALCLVFLAAGGSRSVEATDAASTADRSAAARPAGEKGPQRVLVLSSFGTDFTVLSQVSVTFRTELKLAHRQPIDFYEVVLEQARFDNAENQGAFVAYLGALFGDRQLDLVVTLGGPAARFAHHFRAQLFPQVPVLFAAQNPRNVSADQLGPLDASSPVEFDLTEAPETVLQLLPQTQHLAIVLGTSPLERFWRAEIERALVPYEDRLQPIWLDGLSLDSTLERVASLPPRSAVYFVMFLVDGDGTPHSQDRVLQALHQRSNSPLFGVFDNQIGSGVVGGRMTPVYQIGRQAADAAAQLLSGTPPSAVRVPEVRATTAIYDARELERWKVPQSRLPPGSEVRFGAGSPWVLYRAPIFLAVAVLVLETALLAVLFFHRARRRAAEREVRALHGRLLTAYEQERRRLARELHDDLTQRLARLAIDAAQLERQGPTAAGGETLRMMREELVRLSHDVHTLARQLHPSVLDDLGLAEALRSEGERFANAEALALELEIAEAPASLDADTRLCLYRVAQEALRNVGRHARASRIRISLREANGGLELEVRDNGVGFEPELEKRRLGLGHVSLRERLHLVGGRLEVMSSPGRGTTLLAWTPLGGAST